MDKDIGCRHLDCKYHANVTSSLYDGALRC